MVVVDASAALAWLLPSQRTRAAFAFLTVNVDPFVAPAVFPWEVGNVLVRRVNRGVISRARWAAMLEQWASYGIAVADPVDSEPLALLALEEELSLFDASYLALALGLQADLTSRDADLIAAARRHDLRVHDLRDDP